MAAVSQSGSPTSPTNNKQLPQRPSRFIESEAFTRTPSSRSNPFLSSVLSEQDQHHSPSHHVSPATPNSTSPTFRTAQLQRKFSWEDSPSEETQSPSFTSPSHPLFRRFELPGRSSRTVQGQKGRRSLEERRRRGKDREFHFQRDVDAGKERERGITGENIVGRLRALTTGQSTLERKMMAGEVTVYPGT
jgi:hypothetical protein